MADMRIKEVVSQLHALISDTIKSLLTTEEKKKQISLIKKVYYWIKENAPRMKADEEHLNELVTRMIEIDYRPPVAAGRAEVDDEDYASGDLEDTGDDLLDTIKLVQKNLLDSGLERSVYSDEKLERASDAADEQFQDMKKTLEALKSSVVDAKTMVGSMEDIDPGELKSLQENKAKQATDLEKHRSNITETTEENKQKEENVKKLKKGNEENNKKLAEEEVKRRWLHNEVQDLRGNIRVFCRTRKFLPKESKKPYDIPHIDIIDEFRMVIKKEQSSMRRAFSKAPAGGDDDFVKENFKFDHVFGPRANQADIFTEVDPLIQSVLDGFNVCLFAYGQTGAGKSFTMSGGKGEDRGLIPRSVEMIFAKVNELKKQNWKYKLKVNIVEIYNDMVRDLLQPPKPGIEYVIKEVEVETSEGANDKLGVAKDVIVTNMRIVDVKNAKDTYKCMDEAGARRVTTATECNTESSRSHLVFQMRIEATDPKKQNFFSILNLVDLAGSERLEQSGVSGQQKLEAISINKSLTTLGDVIQALGKRSDHVPYRDCALTYLLRRSLGGNSKTMMMLNINPNAEYYNNSIASLRFGAKVNATHMGTATKSKK